MSLFVLSVTSFYGKNLLITCYFTNTLAALYGIIKLLTSFDKIPIFMVRYAPNILRNIRMHLLIVSLLVALEILITILDFCDIIIYLTIYFSLSVISKLLFLVTFSRIHSRPNLFTRQKTWSPTLLYRAQ